MVMIRTDCSLQHRIVFVATFFVFLLTYGYGSQQQQRQQQQEEESAATGYMKLRLIHPNPSLFSPHKVLIHDSLRLSALLASSPSSSSSPSSPILVSPIVSGASTGSGQYLVELRIGTPPQSILLVADTGSDLIWVRCSACSSSCSLRHPPGTVFLPRRSSTFSPYHCYDRACRLVPPPAAPSPLCYRSTPVHTPCHYSYSYSDSSSSSGLFSRDSATSASLHQQIPKLSFGCAFNTTGPSFSGGPSAHGMMGLGRGPTSFPSQLGRRFGNKFSYCLMDYTLSPPPASYLLIGDGEGRTRTRTRRRHPSFTPLLNNPLSPTFYYVSIEGVSVDGVPLPIDPEVLALDPATGRGGTVIDSGTTLSFLPEPAYRQILAAMERRLRLPRVVAGTRPRSGTPAFDLCVNVTGLGGKQLPRLGLRMAGGAVLSPPPRNYFVEAEEGVKCLALQPLAPASNGAVGGFGIIGNLMQQGFLFVFDRDRQRLSFSRSGCAAAASA